MKARPSAAKRAKELARLNWRKEKEENRQRRKEERQKGPTAPGEDPDIAGIVPGPQPPLE